jgi:hypothetical protein
MDSSMTEVFVSTDDVKVIGGTANVNVEVDFGPQGDRGNLFLVGYGDPNAINHSTEVQALDIYINIDTTDEKYLMIYQLQNVNDTTQWEEVSKLTTDKYSTTRDVAFLNGVSVDSEDFKVSNIIPASLFSTISESRFNIQCTFSNPTKPVANSIVVKPITTEPVSGDIVLPVSINAAEFSGSSWSALNGTHKVHFLITVV